MAQEASYLLNYALNLIERRRRIEIHIPLLAFRPVQIGLDADDPAGEIAIGIFGDGSQIRFKAEAIIAVTDVGAIG